MTLRRFVDVAFAMLVEEYTRLGIDLLSAVEKVSDLGTKAETAAAAAVPDKVDNRQSMDTLMAALAGVKGAPV